MHSTVDPYLELAELRSTHATLQRAYDALERKYRSLIAAVQAGCHGYLDMLAEFDGDDDGDDGDDDPEFRPGVVGAAAS